MTYKTSMTFLDVSMGLLAEWLKALIFQQKKFFKENA
jgi:hypothetical protein